MHLIGVMISRWHEHEQSALNELQLDIFEQGSSTDFRRNVLVPHAMKENRKSFGMYFDLVGLVCVRSTQDQTEHFKTEGAVETCIIFTA